MKSSLCFLLLLLPCFAGKSYAQSMYDRQGRVIATKVNNAQINVTGSTFLIEEGRMIEVLDGVRREDLGINYARPTDENRIEIHQQRRQIGRLLYSRGKSILSCRTSERKGRACGPAL